MGMLQTPAVLRDLTDDSEKHVLNETLREISRRAAVADGDTLRNTTLVTPVVSGAAPATPVANTLYTDSVVKGWVRFDASGTIADDLNVSSVTDVGTGVFTVNWATIFANVNYAVAGAVRRGTAGTGTTSLFMAVAQIASNPAVGSVQVEIEDVGGVEADAEAVTLIAIGDQ